MSKFDSMRNLFRPGPGFWGLGLMGSRDPKQPPNAAENRLSPIVENNSYARTSQNTQHGTMQLFMRAALGQPICGGARVLMTWLVYLSRKQPF